MNYKENRDELKQEKAKLRSLLTGHPSTAEAQEILNLTFTPFVNWNLEEVTLHLKHVYDFNQTEAEKIIEKNREAMQDPHLVAMGTGTKKEEEYEG